MTRTTKAISDELLVSCKKDLKRLGPRGENGRRLQAIISAKEHGILQVAKIYNISRETLMRWIRKFSESGCEGFSVKSGRGRRAKLSHKQKEEIHEYISKEGARLSSKKLKFAISERFGIEVSTVTAYRILKDSGFSYITPRPSHHKKDKVLQEEFKKKS